MNNRNRFLMLFIGIVAFIGVGCEDRRMNNMVADKVYLNNHGENIQDVFKGDDFVYSLHVIKSGIGQTSGEVSLSLDESALSKYEGKYTVLPAELYKIKSNQITMAASDYQVPFEIVFNVSGIEALQATTELTYAVPVKLSSATIELGAENEILSVIVPHVVTPYLEFKTPGLALTTASISTSFSPAETKFYAFVKTNYHNKSDLEYTIEVDEDALEIYNLEKETTYELLPAEAYKIDPTTFVVANLNNEQAFSYYLLKGKVRNGSYMLPLKIKTVSKYGINLAKSTMLIPVSIQD
jgi:hypothetical protein